MHIWGGAPRPLRTFFATLALVLLLAVGAQGAAAEPDFEVSPPVPTAGDSATYTATGLNEGETVSWDFGETAPKLGPEVTHTFATPGAKQVAMTVSKPVLDPEAVFEPAETVTKTVTVNARPAGSFRYTSRTSPPTAGDPVLFLANYSDPDGAEADLEYSWSFGDGESGSGDSVQHEYVAEGPRTVTLTVTDKDGGKAISEKQFDVKPAPPPPPPGDPLASFTYLPDPPHAGETVSFAAAAQAAQGGTITSYSWDFDNDGDFDDATGASPRRQTPGAGTWKVRLKVQQAPTGMTVVVQDIEVRSAVTTPAPRPPAPPANRPPTATFAYAPGAPRTGDLVEFLSASTDSDGQVSAQAWDLDGDNAFDDGTGARVTWRYSTPGARRVRLRVTDDRGASATREAVVTVGARAVAARFLIPFPVVRLTGRVHRRYTEVRSLVVRAPRGSLATVACRGRSCPRRSQSKRLGRSRRASFPAFKRRLRVGVHLSVTVKRTGYVGKYTRFRTRSGAAPARLDLCVVPGVKKPRRCPTR
jgi:PKD repeat protein